MGAHERQCRLCRSIRSAYINLMLAIRLACNYDAHNRRTIRGATMNDPAEPIGSNTDGATDDATPSVVRVTAKLPGPAVEQLRRNAALRGDTLTNGLKGAIATKLYLDQAVKEGGTALIRKRDGTLVELVLP